MKGEHLFQILGMVDEDLLEAADPVSSSPTARRRRYASRRLAAACIALICVSGAAWLLRDGLDPDGGTSAPGEASGSGIAHDTEPLSAEGTTFMSYAGPVFPLTLTEETGGITAERAVSWDLAPDTREDGSVSLWGSTVTDSYLLMNHTTGEILAMACYPVAASLSDLPKDRPTVTVDGVEQEPTLRAGAYAGGFTDAGLDDGSTWNLSPPDSWVDYKTLLEDGGYLAEAFGEVPALDIPVTVYEFSDYVLPENAPDAATQAMTFTIDPSATTILTYGINGMSWDEDSGWRQYSYFVPNGTRWESEHKLLVVLGEDIGPYTLQGYRDGGCDPGEEVEGIGCTVTRYETTLDAVVEDLCRRYEENYAQQWRQDQGTETGPFELVSLELFRAKAAELMTQYGALAGDSTTDRYSGGRLSAILSETLTQERVLYWTFPITIPAGSSVEVTAVFEKEPSFDFGCSGSENAGLQGYDLVTHLGSGLEFTQQTAALTNAETIEITGQNFGFDLENGVTEVHLDPEQEHYYLEIRPKSSPDRD